LQTCRIMALPLSLDIRTFTLACTLDGCFFLWSPHYGVSLASARDRAPKFACELRLAKPDSDTPEAI